MTVLGQRVVFLHAHPDDETLATGALLADLVVDGHQVAVVTATRGERGAVVPGPLSALEGTPELVEHRLGELAGALAELGVTDHVFLGTPPARDGDRLGVQPGGADGPVRRYTDSGMRWLDEAETLAGPGGDAGPDSLTSVPVEQAAADLAAFLRHFGADTLVAYDRRGGYGHPDHVACNHIARAAVSLTGTPLVELVSEPLLPVPGAEEVALPQWLPTVQRALGHYASQLSVDGDQVVHVGGQHQQIVTTVWLTGP